MAKALNFRYLTRFTDYVRILAELGKIQFYQGRTAWCNRHLLLTLTFCMYALRTYAVSFVDIYPALWVSVTALQPM